MDTVLMGKRVIAGAIGALLILACAGGLYLLYAWQKIGSDSASLDAQFTQEQQMRRTPSSFTAPAPSGQAQETPIESPSTPPAFDVPAPSSGGTQPQEEVPDTPSSFDAPV